MNTVKITTTDNGPYVIEGPAKVVDADGNECAPCEERSGLSTRAASFSSRQVPPVEFDRHDTQHVFPVGLVQQGLAQLRLGSGTSQEEVQRLTGYPQGQPRARFRRAIELRLADERPLALAEVDLAVRALRALPSPCGRDALSALL